MSASAVRPVPEPGGCLTAVHKIVAYLKKEWQVELSYTFAFLFSVLGVFTGIATYFFIDRLFGHRITADLAPYGTPYFAYALVGNAFFAYVGSAIGGIPGRLTEEQTQGTLEALLATPTSVWLIVLAMAVWSTLAASIEVGLYFLVGAVGFGADFSRINGVTVACVAVLVIVAFNSIGLLEAACLLVFKRRTAVVWAFNGVSALLGGVFFPVTVLPLWLQRLAEWNPITHAIRALQLGIYQGASVGQVGGEVLALVGFCTVLAPLGCASVRWALHRAKVEGTLSQY